MRLHMAPSSLVGARAWQPDAEGQLQWVGTLPPDPTPTFTDGDLVAPRTTQRTQGRQLAAGTRCVVLAVVSPTVVSILPTRAVPAKGHASRTPAAWLCEIWDLEALGEDG